jgi:hypothetical protein
LSRSAAETLRRAEIAMSPAILDRQWVRTKGMSLEKEAAKRRMVYYATPVGYSPGGFVTALDERRIDQWFEDVVASYTKHTRRLIWC